VTFIFDKGLLRRSRKESDRRERKEERLFKTPATKGCVLIPHKTLQILAREIEKTVGFLLFLTQPKGAGARRRSQCWAGPSRPRHKALKKN